MAVELGPELDRAVAAGDLVAVQSLLSRGADPNNTPADNPPLVVAVQRGKLAIADALLRAGAEVNRGFPLHAAAGKGKVEAVRMLLARGADVNLKAPPPYLETPLHSAARGFGVPQVCQELINAGATLDAQAQHGFTALHLAVEERNARAARVLLEAGANPNIVATFAAPYYGGTPLFAAVDAQDKEMVECLLAHGASPTVKHPQMGALLDSHSVIWRQTTPEIRGLLLKYRRPWWKFWQSNVRRRGGSASR